MHGAKIQQLSIRGLSFRFPPQEGAAEQSVFDDLSLELPPGRMSVLLGAADAGKTTLARILVGAVPRFTGGTLEGSIELGGTDTRGAKPYELTETFGLVSQSSDEQIFTTRCDTEIAFALESLGMPRAEMVERVDSCLRLMDLERMRLQNPATLSGGEKKRLLVACLAAIRPAVWILDEALSELDLVWRSRVLDFLRSQERTTLLLDSRLTPLLVERGEAFGVIAGHRLRGPFADPHSSDFQALATTEGILAGDLSALRPASRGAKLMRARGIDFRFPGPGSFSLSIDSLEIGTGSVCSLVGRNGSGKSTLGRILCGLQAPRAGSLSLWNGSGYRDVSAEELTRRVGYLFQNPDHQIFLPTAFEELALGLRRQGLARGEITRRVEDASRLFSLPDPAALPALMSFGARRRLQAATYFLLERDLLILDEVDTGLSYRELEALLRVLFSRPVAVLLITHDMELAQGVSDRVILLSAGRVRADLSGGDFHRLRSMLEEDAHGG